MSATPKSKLEWNDSGIDRWVDANYVAAKYSVSYFTARRWIMAILGDDTAMIQKNKGRGKRPKRMRRISLSLLEKEVGRFING
jgi:hypothetical protein